MKVLVFGKTGQVAQALGRYDGVELLGRDGADLANPARCAAVIQRCDADVVINAAAYTAVDKAESEPELATTINAAAPTAMAQAAAARGLGFLHISTDYVFDGQGQKARQELAATGPLNVYGKSKLAGEQGVMAANGQAMILRTSWVFSAQGQNFVKTMLRLGLTRAQLGIVSDQIGGPTSAGSIAAALMKMAKVGGAGGVYHFSGAPETGWDGFAREIFRQAKMEVAVQGIPSADYPTPAQRPLYAVLDCTKIEQEFGISAPDWRADLSGVLRELEAFK